jgi:Domain of unknown function (DUF892)
LYGTLFRFARQLGLQEATSSPDKILAKEKAADAKLSQPSESAMNLRAAQQNHRGRPLWRRICLGHKKINFSQVFAGRAVGIKEVQDDIWLVSFMDYDLGYFDLETRVLEPLDNPFGPKLLPM